MLCSLEERAAGVIVVLSIIAARFSVDPAREWP
jgi:hypothetical protein